MTIKSTKNTNKTPVGELRPSQMMFTYGVGSVVDLPKMAAMVMGLDDWDTAFTREIGEERLLAAVQSVLGTQVKMMRTPPTPPESNTGTATEPSTIGVPVAPFPRWMVCPYCRLLAPLGSSMIELRPNPYRMERTSYVHTNCRKPGSRPPDMNPVRFLLACKGGHLDDFPWVWFVHEGPTECRGALYLFDLSASGEAAYVEVRCEGCKKSRRLSDAFGEDGKKNLPPLCKGRRPHLRDYDEKTCKEPVRAMTLGASNAWFPLTMSALYLPTATDKLAGLIDENWTTLEKIMDATQVTLLRTLNMLNVFIDYTDQEVWAGIEAKRNGTGGPEYTDPRDLKTPEWAIFSNPDPARNAPDFRLTPVGAPAGYELLFAKTVLVERIREVNALIGFTRIESPGDFSDIEEVPEERRVPLARKPPTWVPASEVRGEGLFLQFNQDALERWLNGPAVRERDRVFLQAHARWREARFLTPPDQGYPSIAYVLLHSFSHALMRQLALECGYTAASIRERIYCRPGNLLQEPQSGVLIYTAAPDSEGTLGGLVSLGEPQTLGRHIAQALEMMRLCASDPLCAEHHPYQDGITLHGASCHACLFAPETSCERSNKYLDRSVLVPTYDQPDLAFFPTLE